MRGLREGWPYTGGRIHMVPMLKLCFGFSFPFELAKFCEFQNALCNLKRCVPGCQSLLDFHSIYTCIHIHTHIGICRLILHQVRKCTDELWGRVYALFHSHTGQTADQPRFQLRAALLGASSLSQSLSTKHSFVSKHSASQPLYSSVWGPY